MYLIFSLDIMDSSKLENDLISELKLSPIQAKTFLLITWYGKMTALEIADKLKISSESAQKTATALRVLVHLLIYLKLNLKQCIQDLLQLTCIEKCVNEKILNLSETKLLII